MLREEDIKPYLNAVLGMDAQLTPLEQPGGLPYYLLDRYLLLRLRLLDINCVLAIQRHAAEGVGQTRKQLEAISRETAQLTILATDSLSAAARRQLIQARVPFVVPGKQLFIPQLALDLQERFARAKPVGDHLSPAAQALLIRALHERLDQSNGYFAMQLLTLGGVYTAMTISRVAREWVEFGLAQQKKIGRERHIKLAGSAEEIWQRAEPLLRSPIKRTSAIKRLPDNGQGWRYAGLTALAQRSLIQSPARPVIAMSLEFWKTDAGAELDPDDDTHGCDCQIWLYPPDLIGQAREVDPVSLYLSLKDMSDDRIQIALEEVKRKFPWCMG